MTDNRYSIIVKDFERCLICGTYLNINKHEIFFGTANRKLSIKYGLVVPLCIRHHTNPKTGVHYNKKLNEKLRQQGQKAFEYHYPELDFKKIFGRNYL